MISKIPFCTEDCHVLTNLKIDSKEKIKHTKNKQKNI